MVVYGEGRYALPASTAIVRPGPRRAADLDAGRFEPPCPLCGRALAPETVPEDAPLDPRNVYAATKLAQEHLCAALSRETGVPVTALRYHNVYGPRMPRDTPYAGVASIFRSALRGRRRAPRVFEDGGQRRDFVHVRDVAARQRARAHRAEPVAGRVQRRQRHAAHACSTWRARSPRAFAREHEPVVTGEWRARRRPPRVRLRRSAPPSGSASARGEDFDAGDARVRLRPAAGLVS